jgi:hypothetical protein
MLYHVSHPSSPLVILEMGVYLCAQADLDCDPAIFSFLLLLGRQGLTTLPSFFPLRWVLTNIFLAKVGFELVILLMSASQEGCCLLFIDKHSEGPCDG